MSVSTLPLSYCTNVHPGRSVDEVIDGLLRYTAPVQAASGGPLAAGLWLAAAVIRELTDSPPAVNRLAETLLSHGLLCYTLNAFPYGDFHSDSVKEQVYLPDWTAEERLQYTARCADILARLLPDGVEGSLSTVPLGFKELPKGEDFEDLCITNLLHLTRHLDHLHDETGRVIRLAIEPEPLCILETTAETVQFFDRLFQSASARGLDDLAHRHLGVCYDVCHQAVEFEDVAASIADLTAAGIRINKVHITCALRLTDPATRPEARESLAQFAEPRYLHQTLARNARGEVLRWTDLSPEFAARPPAEFLSAAEWRTHFHVPVNAESIGPLQTTRDDLRRALQTVAQLTYAPHLEVETYTWSVLPGETAPSLVEGLAAELIATRALLAELR